MVSLHAASQFPVAYVSLDLAQSCHNIKSMKMGLIIPFGVVVMLLPICLARDYFKSQSVLWPTDADLIQDTAKPSRFACGSWCSTLGTECSVFEYSASGNCKTSKLGIVSSSSLTQTRRSSWLKRGLPMSVEGGVGSMLCKL